MPNSLYSMQFLWIIQVTSTRGNKQKIILCMLNVIDMLRKEETF